MGNLTVKFVETVKAEGKKKTYGDDEWMELQVECTKRKGIVKTWMARYSWDNKASNKTLGHFPSTKLSDVRKLNRAFRNHLNAGLPPDSFISPKCSRE